MTGEDLDALQEVVAETTATPEWKATVERNYWREVPLQDEQMDAFVQDEIELSADKLYLTLGSKFEENDYTGSEIQPNIRLSWHTSETDTLWAAISRAVRTRSTRPSAPSPWRMFQVATLQGAATGPGAGGVTADSPARAVP